MFLDLMKKKKTFSQDEIADFLKINPEALAQFETVYQDLSMNEEVVDGMNFFDINARMAKKANKETQANTQTNTKINFEQLEEIKHKIVDELLSKEETLQITDGEIKEQNYIVPQDLRNIPLSLRPQLTGHFITKDIGGNTGEELITQYMLWKQKGDIRFYHSFRQGLDILDLDPLTYAILGENPNSMGYWFDDVKNASKFTFLKIPNTKIVKVPLPILQLTRLDYMQLNKTTLDIVNEFCMKAFDLDINKKYFIKTGTFSSKFDFRNALVQGQQEVRELGEYLLFIHFQANQMASPLSKPSIYGVSTTNEWVVREFVEDVEDNPTIYKGMPLRTEYRFFVDLDTKEILGVSPYWREDVMKQSFSSGPQDNHKKHDYIIYKMHEEKLYDKYNKNVDKLTQEVQKLVNNMTLSGQWSIDIMQNGNDFYVIDLALAHQSALNDCVDKSKLNIPQEHWLPKELKQLK